MPTAQAVTTVAAAVAFLAIALLAAVRGTNNPLAIQLALMSVGLFAYNSLDVLASASGRPRWDWLGYAAAALSLIPALNLLLGFVGKRRRFRLLTRLFALYLGAAALLTLAPFVRPSLAAFPGSATWAAIMLIAVLPAFSVAGALLWRHARASSDRERARSRLMAAALLLGVGAVVVDLAAIAAGHRLGLSAAGLVGSAILLAALVLKARILEGVTALTMVTAASFAILAVLAQILVFVWAGTRTALVVFGSLVVVLALLGALRPLLKALAEHQARTDYLATLGRFAEQMAHDLRNPLAAIRGAAQLLQQEAAEGRSLDPHGAYVELILDRATRLEQVIHEYQRMGRVEPVRREVDINALVQAVVDGQRLGRGASGLCGKTGDGVGAPSPGQAASTDAPERIELELDSKLPTCPVDWELLERALDNIVRNAVQATATEGQVSASTTLVQTEDGRTVRIRVRDSGHGMDAPTRERAFEEFFTTRADGSGLGLAYAAKVIEAHGGTVDLRSAEGRGTTVDVHLPVETSAMADGT